jgi:hypothetical protein
MYMAPKHCTCLYPPIGVCRAAAGVKLFTFISIWCLLVVMPVNMTVSAAQLSHCYDVQ